MGLTGAQGDGGSVDVLSGLETLVDQARALGPGRPPDWVPTRARALGTEIAGQPSRTNTGWP